MSLRNDRRQVAGEGYSTTSSRARFGTGIKRRFAGGWVFSAVRQKPSPNLSHFVCAGRFFHMAKPFKRLPPPSAKRVGARIVLVEYLQMKSLSSVGLLLFYLAVCSQASGLSGVAAQAGPKPQFPKTSIAHEAQLAKSYGNLPLSFEANIGQADKSVKFLSRITLVDSLKNVGDGKGSISPAYGYSWYAGI